MVITMVIQVSKVSYILGIRIRGDYHGCKSKQRKLNFGGTDFGMIKNVIQVKQSKLYFGGKNLG